MSEKNLPTSLRFEDLEKYSVAELEEMAVQASWRINSQEDKTRFRTILRVRKHKLNDSFEWTPENKKKLLRLDRMVLDCIRKLETEARNTLQIIQSRIDAKDEFLHDFNMDAEISPYIYGEDGAYPEENTIEGVLSDNWENFCWGSVIVSTGDLDSILDIDKDLNYNQAIGFRGKFDDCFLSRALYELDEIAVGWSFPDMLKINHLWAELKVDYQHSMDFHTTPTNINRNGNAFL